jgi:alpha-glucosidase
MKITDLLRTLRFIGWENPYRAILYSILRARAERGIKREDKLEPTERFAPGQIISANGTVHGAGFRFENADLEILFLAEDVVRISWQPGEPPVPYAIQDHFWPGGDARLTEDKGSWKLSAGDLSVRVSSEGCLTWSLNDTVIRSEDEPIRVDSAWESRSPLPTSSAVFGLGGRARSLNLRGGSYRLWNRDPGGSYGPGDDPLYLNVPAFMVLQDDSSYLVFYENSYRGFVKVEEELSVRFEAGMLRYYLFFGEPESLLKRFTDLTGKPAMPPKWALGFHQSRWGYRSEDDIEEVLAGYQQHNLPISAIHLDIDYMDGYRVFTTNPHSFPNLKQLTGRADKLGVRVVAIIDPGVKVDRGFQLYRDGLFEDVFCKLPSDRPARAPVWPGWVVFPDFTNPSARRWWGSQYPRLLKHGITGIWHDMNEPATFAAWGDPSLPLATQHALEGKGGTHRQAHNVYGLLMNRTGFEALKSQQPEQRPFIVSRSGWAGNQRYAWNWTGDVESTWEGMRVTLQLMLGMSLSGIFFTGSDIGGFSGEPSPELMVRWMQMAALTPFFRIHSALTAPRREPWRFESPHREALYEMLSMRYRLMPYLYTLAWQAASDGLPIIRPLFWDDPSNATYWDVDDQFFLGADMLVAPILGEGLRERKVTLPDGTWHSYWDNASFQGPARVTARAPLERLPIFVRSGAVLPLEGSNLELHVFPGSKTTSTSKLYLDSGDGFGPYRVDTFRLIPDGDGVELEWTQEGEYQFPYDQIEIHLHGGVPRSVKVDGGEEVAASLPLITDGFRRLRFEF